MSITYVRYELLRNTRNWRLSLFSAAFPLVLYCMVTGSQRGTDLQGVPFEVGFMSAMMTLNAMACAIANCVVIAAEHSNGWTRQLKIMPLGTATYLGTKAVNVYLRALLGIGVLALAGVAYGVRLSAGTWLTLIGLILIGVVPFVILGILLGDVLRADTAGVTTGGLVSLFALLGGAYGFQVATSGPLLVAVKALPSYWLVQAASSAIRLGSWPLQSWLVIASWTAVLIPLTVVVHQRTTGRR